MRLIDIGKTKATRVMGVDTSTNSFAFAIIDNGNLVHWGEINFTGPTVFDRVRDASQKMSAVARYFRCDFIVIESSVMVNNISVAIKMAYVFGSILGALLERGVEVVELKPIEWQTAIGNPLLKKPEKDAIIRANPGKSKTWYQNKNREFRKDRTRQFVKKTFGVDIESDNVTDAVGLAYHAYHKLTRR